MKNIQIRCLSVNSISFDYLLLVEVEQTYFNLFIGGKRVIDCSDSSFVQSDVYFFVLEPLILFRESVSALLQYTFVETFTAFLLEVTS